MTTQTKDAKAATDAIDAALAANAEDQANEPVAPATKPASARRRATRRTTDQAADVAPDVQPYNLKSFTTRTVPWGKIGHIESSAKTAMEAAELGGLNFEVELLDAGFKSNEKPPPGKSAWKTIPNRRACVRKDNQQFMSFVSSAYAPVQYGEVFAFMDAINPLYVAAGTLGGGRQGFMVVELPNREKVELKIGKQVDPLTRYVVLRTSHDLTRAIEVSCMLLRDRCMNALTLNSFAANAPQRWSVKHVGDNPLSKIDVAQTTLARSDAYIDGFMQTAKVLADMRVTIDEAKDLLVRILPNRPKRDEQVNAIVNAWRTSENNGFPDRGWGVVNAVSEYFEWGRNEGTRTEQSRFTGGLTGSTHKYTNRAVQLLLQRRR